EVGLKSSVPATKISGKDWQCPQPIIGSFTILLCFTHSTVIETPGFPTINKGRANSGMKCMFLQAFALIISGIGHLPHI
ncbi:MAG: hypothetical protein OEY93_08975, partial [Anaerolineae bacterium]|nr:hypothetical protein [Anaerolineae bacterium]